MNTMKNTSLFASFWAMPKRRPSAEPAERKCARFRAPGGTRVIGAKPLIASCSFAQAYAEGVRDISTLAWILGRNPFWVFASAKHSISLVSHPITDTLYRCGSLDATKYR